MLNAQPDFPLNYQITVLKQQSTTILYLNRIWSVKATDFFVEGMSLILELSLRNRLDLSLRNDVSDGLGRGMVRQ